MHRLRFALLVDRFLDKNVELYYTRTCGNKKHENLRMMWMGGGQNLERRNVERPVFRNFEIANIRITKDQLFDNFIFKLFFSFSEII